MFATVFSHNDTKDLRKRS